MADSIVSLLQQRIATEPARPLVTVISSEGRVELSAVTFGNWVNKTAGLLRDDLGLAPRSLVDVELRMGWQSLAWVHAVWRAGLALGDNAGDAP